MGVFEQPGDGSMAGFVISDGFLFTYFYYFTAVFQPPDNPVDCIQKILFFNFIFVFTGCNQSCFVSDIGNIGSRETRRLLGQERDIHISGQFQRFQVHFENFFPVFQFRQVDIDLAVETSGTKQGAVQNVRPVGCSQNNHPRIGLETVHLGQ